MAYNYNPLTNVSQFLDICGDEKEQQDKDEDGNDDTDTQNNNTCDNYHPRITNMIVTIKIINMTTVYNSMIQYVNTNIPLVPIKLSNLAQQIAKMSKAAFSGGRAFHLCFGMGKCYPLVIQQNYGTR